MDIKKVLLLGGSGYVGTYIVNRLSQRGIEVTVPTRRRERTKALIMQPGVEMPEANIHCEETLVELMRAHAAATCSPATATSAALRVLPVLRLT